MRSTKSSPLTVKITAALVVILACLGLVAATEIVLRFVGLGYPLLYYETDATYRFALRPGQSSVRLRGAHIAIDQYGLRTTEDWGHEDAGLRILFIGDSVTYGGSYIDNSELFSSLVCEHLHGENALNAVCGNAGVNAYGTDNMFGRILAYEGPAVDAIVVTVLSSDTVRGQVQLRQLPFFSKPPPEPIPAIIEAAVFVLDRVRKGVRFGRDNMPPHREEREEAYSRTVAGESLEHLYEALREGIEGDVRVLLVHSPSQESVLQGYDEFDEFVVMHMRTSGLPFLEMRPIVQDSLERGIYHDRVHLDVDGHILYGNAIAEALSPLLIGLN